MLIKLRSLCLNDGAVIYYVDGVVGPEVARAAGILLATKCIGSNGKFGWHLAVKSRPVAPADVSVLYEALPFDETVDTTDMDLSGIDASAVVSR